MPDNGLSIRLILLLILFPSLAFAGHLHKEKEYQAVWCAKMGGEMEVVLDDGARVDCLTDQYAVEVDFAAKWAEGTGQALYYALKTGRRPGILLIMEKEGDERYLKRINQLADWYGITTWIARPIDVEITKVLPAVGVSR